MYTTQRKVVITGGGGFVGYNLCSELLKEGCKVILVDIFPPKHDLPLNCIFEQGDITDAEFMNRVCDGATTVYHLASYGMSGLESLERERICAINVLGTINALSAAKLGNVSFFIYVSTYNTVFIDTPISDGDENLTPHPPEAYKDDYSRTKALAESQVLAANNSLSSNNNFLRTCVIRPAAIYGPGETRHFPRILDTAQRGFLRFVFGDASSRVDWLHVRNLTQALSNAERCLADEAQEDMGRESKVEMEKRKVAGEVFFISDGKPVNNFEFIRPILEGCGYDYPNVRLPYSLIMATAHVVEAVHRILLDRFGLRIQPMLTPTEVRKCAVTHYFKIDKARRLLRYNPQEYDMTEVVASYEHLHRKKLTKRIEHHMKRDNQAGASADVMLGSKDGKCGFTSSKSGRSSNRLGTLLWLSEPLYLGALAGLVATASTGAYFYYFSR